MKSSSAIATDAGHPPAPSSDIGVIAHLPDTIGLAVIQSGILEDERDLSWLDDARTLKALEYASKVHNGETRAHGNKLKLIHEIWCAHNVYNDANLQGWLAQEKLDPLTGSFSAILHDSLENSRDFAEKTGTKFRAKPVFSEIARIWNDAESVMPIIYCVKYMTDAPGLHGKERIDAQIAKSFDADGNCKINPLKQCVRAYDKLSHIVFDELEYSLGNISDEKAQERLVQARQKAFVVKFPAPQIVGPTYRRTTRKFASQVMRSIKDPTDEPAIDLTLPQNLLLAAFACNAKILLLSVGNMEKMLKMGRKTIVKSLKTMGFDL